MKKKDLGINTSILTYSIYSKLVKRNETFARRGSLFSQKTDYAPSSSGLPKSKNPKLPGGGGHIPNDMNFGVFGDAIFEMSDEDDEEYLPLLKNAADASYNIYSIQNKKLLF